MSTIKFNFSSFGKPKIKKINNKPNRKIVERKVIGVIGIRLDATYYVSVNNKEYPLTIESYDNKGKNVYFSIELINNKIQEIIQLKKLNTNIKKYLPFGVGCIVKGNIYDILGRHRFNISKILELSDVPEESVYYYKNLSHTHKEFFRNNYEKIKKCMN